MVDFEILLSVTDDDATQRWLDRALEESWRLESVSRSDLGRVLRLLEATGAHIALVDVVEADINQSLAVITALTNARPWITVVAVARTTDQELLLQCMRAGARDCIVIGGDVVEMRDRLRRHQLVRPAAWGEGLQSRLCNLVLVAGADPLVDTAFFTQHLALAMGRYHKGDDCLAIDVESPHESVFYLDVRSDFDLNHLLSSPDTLDRALIDTALEEYRPGVRLLRGGLGDSDVLGDRGADLFIALNRLMGMFDKVILNLGSRHHAAWVRTLGVHAEHVLLLMHPQVLQVHRVREQVMDWRPYLSSADSLQLVLDGHEPQLPPPLDEITEAAGAQIAGTLPMEWKHRLEVINLGQPISDVAPKSAYPRAMDQLVRQLSGESAGAQARFKWPWKRA